MATRLVDVEVTMPLPAIGVEGYAAVWALVRFEGTPVGWAQVEKVRGVISPKRLAVEIAEQVGEGLLRERVYRDMRDGACRHREGGSSEFATQRPGSPLRSNTGTTVSGIGRGEAFPVKHGEEPTASSGNASPPQGTSLPFITVIVCTRDRAESLEKTLESLTQLEYSAYEVIVVDNCPASDHTRQLLLEYPMFRYVLEPLPGLDLARNRGIAEANGEIVAFIDDDALADPGWLQGLAAGFADGEAACVTGLVVPTELETRAQELFETNYGGFGRGFERRRLLYGDSSWSSYQTSRFGTGCNMAFKKGVFGEIGGFDPAFDVGAATGGGGDMDIFHRLIDAGYVTIYRPDALVRHRHRAKNKDLRRLLFNYGRSYSALLTKWLITEPRSRSLTLSYIARWYAVWFVRRAILPKKLGRKLGHRRMPVGLIAVELVGAFTGPWAYFSAIRTARGLKGGNRAC